MGRLIAFLLALLAGAAQAEPVEFPSADGKLQLQGEWYRAKGTAPRPAVLALHGCNGMRDAQGRVDLSRRRYAAYFNAEGMHVLALDSFTPRGLRSICATPERQRTVNEEDRRRDVYSALQWLAAQPGVDATKLAIVGWSHGAQAVLSSLDATEQLVQSQPVKPRVAVAFYPGCIKFNRMLRYELAAPLLVLIGEADDWTPSAPCVQLHSRLGGSGAMPFELKVYPGAYHGFDGTAPVTVHEGLGNVRFGKAHVGGDPEARAQSHARMFEFLSAQFGQPLLLSHDERLQLKAKPAR
ncbi:dienelactone hydrolase family protein [Ramlibacter sp. PS4R-6]|uniref:dienelactone hydrolase family protein n=1 Tax=Ramlibacter sp. PS4R-6 TaxID=3133438 RepID=UPI0030A7423B